MEIKKFNPDEMEAPLVGGAVDRNVVNTDEPDDLTADDDLTAEDDDLTEDKFADGEDDEIESEDDEDTINDEDEEDATGEEDELNESGENEEESGDRYEDVDGNAFDKN